MTPPRLDTPHIAMAQDQPNTKPAFKRKKRLINKRMQLKMIGVFAAIGLVSALFQIVLVNSSLITIAREAEAGGDYILQQSRPMMLRNVLWTIAALIPLMTCVGIVVTHRVAGPAYRMTQHCKEIAEGGPVTTCRIRKNDEMQDLCAAMNAAFERLAPSADTSEDHTEEWKLEGTPSLVRSKTAGAGAESETAEPAKFFGDDSTAA